MLTDAWTTLGYHPLQYQLWRTPAKMVAVAAGRGSGKTEIARRYVVRWLPVRKPWSNPMYFYALPTHDQAGRVAWPELLKLIPKDWIQDVSVSRRVITTKFGSTLHVFGMDKPARIEGVQWDGGVMDESSDQKPKAFDLSVLPALSHRDAWCWRIGVPKRVGPGAREFKKFFDEGSPPGQGARHESYTWTSASVLPYVKGGMERLQHAQEHLDAKDFAEQYGASWETAGGLLFHAYSDVMNVKEVQYRPELPLLVGSDFNVDPMAWVVGQSRDVTLSPTPPQRVSELHILDELFLRNTNTQKTLDELHRRYASHQGGWMFFGDATGRSRKTSASDSDYAHIKNDRRFLNARVYYAQSNPPRADRFAATNAGFCTAAGERRTMVHPRCTNLRTDLLNRAYEEGTNEPEDHGDVGHITDALGYLMYKMFPVLVDPGKHVPQVVTQQ